MATAPGSKRARSSRRATAGARAIVVVASKIRERAAPPAQSKRSFRAGYSLALRFRTESFYPLAPAPRAQYHPQQPPVGHFLFSNSRPPFLFSNCRHRRPLALGRSHRRARGSMATAPGSKRALGLRWRCRSFPDFARHHQALEDQGETAPVYLTLWESPRADPGRVTLPLTRSLCDFEPKVFIRWRRRRAPNTRKQGDC